MCVSTILFSVIYTYVDLDTGYFYIISVLVCVPCFVDGLLQTFTNYASSNAKRVVFGGLAGIGLAYFAVRINQFLSDLFLF